MRDPLPDADNQPVKLRFTPFELDESEARLLRGGVPVALAPKALAVLCALARQPGKLVTKSELLDRVWGHQHVSESVLKTVISELRGALGDDARRPRFIETASRFGYRFIAEPSAAPITPDAPVAAAPRSAAQPIVGRSDAIERIERAWRDALEGRSCILWIAGEAGIGKTTLIDHAATRLGAPVARGQCVEQYGAGEPYLPVLEAVSALCRDLPALPSLLRTVAPTWAIQLPWLHDEGEREALAKLLAGSSQARMLREFGELLDRMPAPLLLITEDLHWSDQGTLRLIDHVARRRGRAPMLWLASLRLAEVIAQDHPLKSLRNELRLHRLVDEILLEPFSEQELADFLTRRAPTLAESEALVRALHQRTDGLPLFLVSVLDDLLRGEAVENSHGAARMLQQIERSADAVPDSLAGVIERQLVRLDGPAQRFLEAASVCGVEFRISTVAAVLSQPQAAVAALCDTLVRQQQWLHPPELERLPDGRVEPCCAFRHALFRHVFYGRIGALERAGLHRRVANTLAAERVRGLGVAAPELASHFELGHEPLAALTHYVEAAEEALRRFAPAEAVTVTEHALAIVPTVAAGALRDGLELALAAFKGAALAQLRGVSSIEARQAFESALSLLERMPSHPLRGLVLQGYGIVLMVRGENRLACEMAEHAHALSGYGADPVLFLSACSVLGQVKALQGRQREARDWLERGIACCESLGDEGLQAAFVVDPAVTLHATLALTLLHLGELGAARRQSDRAQQRARQLGEPMARMVASWFAAFLASRLDDYDGVAAQGETMQTVSRDAALAQGHAANQWFRGHALANQGQPCEGYRLIRDAYDANAALGMYAGGTEVLGYAAEALLLAGDAAAADDHLNEAQALSQRLGERVCLPHLLLLRAAVRQTQGDAAAARQIREAALGEARAQQNVWSELKTLSAMLEAAPADTALRSALGALLTRLDDGDPCAPLARARVLVAA